jgi:hypothetical protein
MAVEAQVNYADPLTSAIIPFDAIIRTTSSTAPTAGQSVRPTSAIGDGSDTGYLASVSAAQALQVWSFAATAALTQVAASATSVSLLASNAARKGAVITNTGTNTLYVAFAASASATAFTYQIGAGQALTLPVPVYQGAISGLWLGTGGDAVITEMS